MNTLRFFAVATLGVLCPLAALADDAAPAAPAAAPATPAAPAADAAGVTLRLKFTPGQTLYYTMNADTTGTLMMGQAGAGMPLDIHMEMLMHQTVKDVRASDGAATIEAGLDRMTMRMNNQTFPMPQDKMAQMKTIGTTVVLPNGKTLSFTPNPALGATPAMPGMDMSHTNALGSLGQLPDAAVKVNDSWKSTIAMGMMGAQVASSFTLDSLDTAVLTPGSADTKTVAVITQTTDGTFDTSAAAKDAAAPPPPMGMTMVGTVKGTGKLRFDVGAGTVEGQTSHADIAMTMTPPGATAPIKMQMKMNSTLRHVPAPANPAMQ